MDKILRTNLVTYLDENSGKYLEWLDNILYSPYSDLDKLEFAIISAHCNMTLAIKGFKASRGIEGLTDLADILDVSGVMAPFNKAGYISGLREALDNGEITYPSPSYRDYRKGTKLPGLGYCKLSFAISLIDPFGATTICLDTHMLQLLLGRRPDNKEMNRIHRRLDVYEELEEEIESMSDETGLPMFGVQWACWDYKRAVYDLLPPNDHSFLWSNGSTTEQLELI